MRRKMPHPIRIGEIPLVVSDHRRQRFGEVDFGDPRLRAPAAMIGEGLMEEAIDRLLAVATFENIAPGLAQDPSNMLVRVRGRAWSGDGRGALGPDPGP